MKDYKEIKVGKFFEDCSYHACICTENNEGDIMGISLLDGKWSGCDYYHCGVIPLTLKQVLEHKSIFDKDSDKGLAIKYGGWTEESYDKFKKEWRN